MLDFASSLYLGLRHPSDALAPWDALSLGRPAALHEPCGAVAAARELAQLVGCEAGTLLPSTFHLFWDLFGVLSREPIEIYMDAATYPIARWSAEHWTAKGVPLRTFAPCDTGGLARLLRRGTGRRPVVLSDSVWPGRDRRPPLAAYAALAQRHGGWLVVDDTQGLGVHGRAPSPRAPYGSGGGGALQRLGLAGDHLVVGASLAKGFGVPVALLAGSAALLRRFERDSASREHMSPPSVAVIHAARHAVQLNRRHGERLRLALWRAVQRLRRGLRVFGIATRGGDFPVQTLVLPASADARRLHARLLRSGVRTVLHRDRGGGARLSFLLRAEHAAAQIDHAVASVSQAWPAALEPA